MSPVSAPACGLAIGSADGSSHTSVLSTSTVFVAVGVPIASTPPNALAKPYAASAVPPIFAIFPTAPRVFCANVG